MVRSLLEIASRYVAENIQLMGYELIQDYVPGPLLLSILPHLNVFDLYQLHDIVISKGIDPQVFWKEHAIKRWPRRYTHEGIHWFWNGVQHIDSTAGKPTNWLQTYLSNHINNILRIYFVSTSKIDYGSFLTVVFTNPFSVVATARDVTFTEVHPERLIRSFLSDSSNNHLKIDEKMIEHLLNCTIALDYLKQHSKRLSLYRCRTDSVLELVNVLTRNGVLEELHLINCFIKDEVIRPLFLKCSPTNKCKDGLCCHGNALTVYKPEEEVDDLFDMAVAGDDERQSCARNKHVDIIYNCHGNRGFDGKEVELYEGLEPSEAVFPGLRSLVLQGVWISVSAAKVLGQELKNWNRLTALTLNYCPHHKDCAVYKYILQGLIDGSKNSHLTHLVICDYDTLPKLQVLQLIHCYTRCESESARFVKFDLSYTELSFLEDESSTLFSHNSFANVQTPFSFAYSLSLGGMRLRSLDDITGLSFMMKHDAALRHLNLSDCSLMYEQLNCVFQAVTDSYQIESLDVSDNSYHLTNEETQDDSGLVAMIQSSSLARLNINHCKLGNLSSRLVDALRLNTNLRVLWIAENRLGDSNVIKLGSVFQTEDNKCISNIEVLDISSNCITANGLLQFASSLKPKCSDRKLRDVAVYGNWFGNNNENVAPVKTELEKLVNVVRMASTLLATEGSTAEHASQM
ncbi:leucine-rich repeat-containing protein 41-like [Saccoglossus kowalevskii]|uniref:Leucine-rich repeat-containing protein 41 n=1 Tax=Saccoglossus kowalevskii TaxID=10224 RepID=A0ABM0LU88_SACKO|nr:PREDICTED: leucine-rich repeat-containing protein 41-like [Saccoglossus kowalevskii]